MIATKRFAAAALIGLLVVSGALAIYSNFPRSIYNVLLSEGGSRYTNHPKDPGGPTKYGITLNDVRRYINSAATAQHVKNLTEEQARFIYEQRYWNALRASDLPLGVDYTIFDYGVNSGVARAGRVLRRVLNLPTDDWRVTEEVLQAIKKKGVRTTILAVNAERKRFVNSLRTCATFCKGWNRRIKSVRAISLNMAGLRPEAGMPLDVFRNLLQQKPGPGKAYDSLGSETP